MELVVDANILISGLLKDGITRAILISNKFDLFTSEFIYTELFNHINQLSKKADLSVKEFTEMIEILIAESGIKLITIDDVKPFINTADSISPDVDDSLYFSVALKLNCPIWSNDKDLKNQEIIKIYSTSDLVKMLKKGL